MPRHSGQLQRRAGGSPGSGQQEQGDGFRQTKALLAAHHKAHQKGIQADKQEHSLQCQPQTELGCIAFPLIRGLGEENPPLIEAFIFPILLQQQGQADRLAENSQE